MNEKDTQLIDWEFKVDEISAGVYRVIGADRKGRIVERIGTEPEQLLFDCKADAKKLFERK
jgi:hypothetical protein